MSIVPAAASFASTIFSYFSPTKSPYYSVIAFSAVALALSVEIEENFFLVALPIFLVMLFSTGLAMRSKPDFTSVEYNSQLRFARSFGISSGVLCLAFLGLGVPPQPTGENFDTIANTWSFWLGYGTAAGQTALFMLYIFIYHNYESTQRGVNFIQLSLVFGSFLIAATYVQVEHGADDPNEVVVLLGFYLLWALCALFILGYLLRNFRMQRPDDAVDTTARADAGLAP